MGAYKSLFQDNADQSISLHIHPSKSDWIIAHATAANCEYRLSLPHITCALN